VSFNLARLLINGIAGVLPAMVYQQPTPQSMVLQSYFGIDLLVRSRVESASQPNCGLPISRKVASQCIGTASTAPETFHSSMGRDLSWRPRVLMIREGRPIDLPERRCRGTFHVEPSHTFRPHGQLGFARRIRVDRASDQKPSRIDCSR
jgi:hypothetical protein